MRLSMTFPTFRSLLAVPFLAAILTFPAAAEPNPNNSTPRVEAQTEDRRHRSKRHGRGECRHH